MLISDPTDPVVKAQHKMLSRSMIKRVLIQMEAKQIPPGDPINYLMLIPQSACGVAYLLGLAPYCPVNDRNSLYVRLDNGY